MSFTVGAGFHSGDFHYGYLRLKLTQQFPRMVLDGKANNLFHKNSNLWETFSHSQIVPLGGETDKHFTLYVPHGYEADVRRLFTPEVTATLVSLGTEYDFEVIGDELFVYHEGSFKLADETALRGLLQFAQQMGGELLDHTAWYDEDRSARSSQAAAAPPVPRLKVQPVSSVFIGLTASMLAVIALTIIFKSPIALVVFFAVFMAYLVAASRVHKK